MLTCTPEAAAAAAAAAAADTEEITVMLDRMVADGVADVDEAGDTVEVAVAVEATENTVRANRNNRTSIYPTATMRTTSGKQ